MNKFLYHVKLGLTLVFLVFAASCGGGSNSSDSFGESTIDWVFMVYMAADNNLDSSAVTDLEEMKSSRLNGDRVRFIVLCDRQGNNNTHLYEPIGGKLKRLSSTELGLTATGNEELDTGSPVTLEKFITFVKSKYKANHYGLVLWNHGGGWRDRGGNNKSSFARSRANHGFNGQKSPKNSENGFVVKDICWDDLSTSYLGNNAVQQVLKGKGIDLLCMDACLMGMVETAYEMRKSKTGIGHIVFSENIIPGNGYPYTTIINALLDALKTTPADFGKIIVDKYFDFYPDSGATNVVTLSLVNLDLIDEVVTSLNEFVSYLETLPNLNTVDYSRQNVQAYDTPQHVDLYKFADGFADASAANLKTSLNNAIVYEKHNSGVSDSHGLSIYFPLVTKDASYKGNNNTESIDFLDDSTWDDYLQARNFGYTIDDVEPQTNANGEITSYVAVSKNSPELGYTLDPYISDSNWGDEDFYYLTVTTGGSLNVSLTSVPWNCDLDMSLYEEANNGSLIHLKYVNNHGYGEGENLIYNIESSKSYFIVVAPVTGDSFSLSDSYSLSFSGTAEY